MTPEPSMAARPAGTPLGVEPGRRASPVLTAPGAPPESAGALGTLLDTVTRAMGAATAQPIAPVPAPVTPAPLGTASTAEAGVSGRTSTGAPAGILDDLAIHLFLTGHALPGLPSAIPTGVVFDVPVPPGRVAAS